EKVKQTKGLSSRVREQGLQFLYYRSVGEKVKQTKGLSSRVREQGLSLSLRNPGKIATLLSKAAKPGTDPSRSGTRSLVSVPFCSSITGIEATGTSVAEELHPKKVRESP
ncbi:MAG: hypothetical protein ACLFTT_05130, partial [Candidatus Hydrogenedentota bacterium]